MSNIAGSVKTESRAGAAKRSRWDTRSLCENAYLLFIAIFCLLKALGFYEGQTIFNAGMIVALAFLALNVLFSPKSGLSWTVTILLFGIGGLVYYNTGEKSLLINLAFLAGFRCTSEKRVMKAGLVTWGTGYVILTFLSLVGLHADRLYMHNKHGIGFVVCHSLGYAHSNVLHINYLCICAMILFLVKDVLTVRQKLILTGILVLVDLYVFLYSMSFTGLAASFLFFFLYVYGILRGRLSLVEQVLAEIVLPFCLLFSLVGPLVIRGTLFDKINNALNTRYYLTKWFLTSQPLTLFGSRLSVPNFRYTLDCSYAYLLVQLGIVPFILLMLLYLRTIHRLVKEQRMTELAIVLGLCIAGVTEPFLFNLSFKNISLVFAAEELWTFVKRIEEKKRERAFFKVKSLSGDSTEGMGVQEETRDPALLSFFTRSMARVVRMWQRRWKVLLPITILIGAAACAVCRLTVKPAETVYVGTSFNEDFTKPVVYLSGYDIEKIEKEGDIVLGTGGPENAYYLYTGSTAKIEYGRIVISWDVWTAGAAALVLAAAEWRTERKKEYGC